MDNLGINARGNDSLKLHDGGVAVIKRGSNAQSKTKRNACDCSLPLCAENTYFKPVKLGHRDKKWRAVILEEA